MSATPTPNLRPERNPIWTWIGVIVLLVVLAGVFFEMASSRLSHELHEPSQAPADQGPVEPH